MSKIKEVLEELGNKIGSIEGKVSTGRKQVTAYKQEIIDRLKGVVSSLAKIQDSSELKQIPELRGKLAESNRLLDEKNKELSEKTSELEAMKASMAQQQQELKTLNDNINKTTTQLNEAKTEIANAKSETDKVKQEKEQAVTDLTSQLENLKQEKDTVEKNLAGAQGELDTIVATIVTINDNLQKQIDMIDTITNELNVDGPMSDEFKAITDNIATIMMMLQNTTNTSSSNSTSMIDKTPFYDKYNLLTQEQKDEVLLEIPYDLRIVIEKDLGIITSDETDPKKKQNSKRNINNILKKHAEGKTSYMGGRTKKRRGKRSRKIYRGGYVYSSSKKLDKASSVISLSSNSRSSSSGSKSRRKNSFKSRRLSRKK
jgi:DNA repair exonuclease SbcCD ATPase subunit